VRDDGEFEAVEVVGHRVDGVDRVLTDEGNLGREKSVIESRKKERIKAGNKEGINK